MTQSLSAGRILLTNALGQKRLDTDDQLFHDIGGAISGTTSFSSEVGSKTQTLTRVLATVPADATHVIGSFKVSGGAFSIASQGPNASFSSGSALGSNWGSVFGGSILFGVGFLFNSSSSIPEMYCWQICFGTFKISGTDLVLERRLRMKADSGQVQFSALTVDYDLIVGRFT